MRVSIEAHLGSRQVAKVVYGSIIGLALVVALAGHPPSTAAVIVSLLGTAVAVGLAELYSEVVGAETSNRHSVTRHQLAHMLDDAVAVAFGIAFPALFFLLALVHLDLGGHRVQPREMERAGPDRLLRLLGGALRRGARPAGAGARRHRRAHRRGAHRAQVTPALAARFVRCG